MTHFSVREREGRDVRKHGRQQERGSVERERGRKEDKLHMIHACKSLHAHKHKHTNKELSAHQGWSLGQNKSKAMTFSVERGWVLRLDSLLIKKNKKQNRISHAGDGLITHISTAPLG